jgi:hypothetical protein
MKKQLVIIGIIILLVSIGLSGCNEVNNPIKSEKDKFVGTWLTDENVTGYIFFSDGTGSYANIVSIIWEIKDGKLLVTIPSQDFTSTYSYVFLNNDKNLTLTSGNAIVQLTKQ